jgi:hypothetical protein
MNQPFRASQVVSEMLTEAKGKEGDYIVWKGAEGSEYKYVNLYNDKYCKRSGIVEVEPMRYNKGIGGVNKHDNYARIKRYRDKKTKLLWGLPLEYNDTMKSITHEEIIMEGKMMFDLSIEEDAFKFAIIKNSPYVEGSPNSDGRPTFKIVDKEVKAETNINKRVLRQRAENIIAKLKYDELVEMARNFGVNVEANRSLAMLTEEVYRVAEADPRMFLEVWENPQREYISIFHRALAKGVIKQDRIASSFMFNAYTLGQSKEMAIKNLVDNHGITTAIKLICDEQDNGTLESMSFVKPDVNEEMEKLKAELAELRAKQTIKADVTSEDSTSYEKIVDTEFEALKAEAKELKIPGWAVTPKDKLKDKVEAFKNKE